MQRKPLSGIVRFHRSSKAEFSPKIEASDPFCILPLLCHTFKIGKLGVRWGENLGSSTKPYKCQPETQDGAYTSP